jgi:hypothetical protein
MSEHQQEPSTTIFDAFKKTWHESDIKLVNEAIVFAAEKHTTQRRKDKAKSPYIEHPLRVMRYLLRANIFDPVTLAVAVLHDTVEDTNTTFEEIEKLFGKDVAAGVRDVTDDKSLDKVERKRLQVIHANGKHMTMAGLLVKLADKLDNLTDRVTNPPEFCSKEENEGYFLWAWEVVHDVMGINSILRSQLVDVFDKANVGFVVDYNRNVSIDNLPTRLESYYQLLSRQEEEKLLSKKQKQ